jgi:hypothetical protein
MLLPGPAEGFGSPGKPVDGVICMLKKVRRVRMLELISHVKSFSDDSL